MRENQLEIGLHADDTAEAVISIIESVLEMKSLMLQADLSKKIKRL